MRNVSCPFRIRYAPAVPLPFATIPSNSILAVLFFQCLIVVYDVALWFMRLGTFRDFGAVFARCFRQRLPCFAYPAPSSPLTTFLFFKCSGHGKCGGLLVLVLRWWQTVAVIKAAVGARQLLFPKSLCGSWCHTSKPPTHSAITTSHIVLPVLFL
jgi:hypothetical protein